MMSENFSRAEYLPPLEPTPEQVIPQSYFIVSWALIALNVLVFAAMCLKGISVVQPTSRDVLPWGADFGPFTLSGEWWRALTSMFLHFGVLHIGMNMYILYQIGPFTELLYGRARFLVLYLLAGLGGSLLSLAVHPLTVSAGASGAIFGVYGGLLAFLIVQRGVIPAERSKAIMQSAGIFLIYNLAYGLRSRTTDLAAHGGGLVAGFVVGALLAKPAVAGTRKTPVMRTAMVALVGLGLVAVSLQALARHDHFSGVLYRDVMLAPSVPLGDKGHVIYAGNATKADAESLAKAFTSMSDFQQDGLDVALTKRGGGTDISYLVNDKAVVSPEVASTIADLTREAAGAVGGLPVTVHLIDEDMVDRKTFVVR